MNKCCNNCRNACVEQHATICCMKDKHGYAQSIINPEKFSCPAYEPNKSYTDGGLRYNRMQKIRPIDANQLVKLFDKQKRYATSEAIWCIDRAIENVNDAETIDFDEKSIELMEENEKLIEALSDLIYLCESSDKAIDCLSDEFLRIKKIAECSYSD